MRLFFKSKNIRKIIFVGFLTLIGGIQTGCSLAPGLQIQTKTAIQQDPLMVEPTAIQTDGAYLVNVTPEVLGRLQKISVARRTAAAEKVAQNDQVLRMQTTNYAYRVGTGDILAVTVDDIELSGQAKAGDNISQRVVQPDGTFFFPLAGNVNAAGRTVPEIREDLNRKMATFLRKPQIDVRVAEFRNRYVRVTGNVKTPGVYPITDTELRMVDVLSRAGWIPEASTAGTVILIRNEQQIEIPFDDLQKGAYDYRLNGGDIVYVPDNLGSRIYVEGEVNQQGVLYMKKGRMNLSDAIGESKGLNLKASNGRGVFIVRSLNKILPNGTETTPVVYGFDLSQPGAMLMATKFELYPNDVVMVASAKLYGYNGLVGQILPTLQALFNLYVLANRF